MKKTIILAIAASIIFTNCKKEGIVAEKISNNTGYTKTTGVYIVNEGNFNSGNSSISFLSLDNMTIQNNIYSGANGLPLGDVAQSMIILDNKGYIVVNNSGKIEIVDLNTFKSIGSVSGLTSPRYLCRIDSQKIYVSDLYSNKIAIINPNTLSIEGYINTNCSTEQMIMVKNHVFVTNWTGNKLLVVDAEADAVIKEIETTKEPNSMVLDKDSNIWVLCSGGYMHEELATLQHINTGNFSIISTITFNNINDYPTRLTINSTKDTLFYLNTHIYALSVNSSEISNNQIVNGTGYRFYGLKADPNSNILYATDAVDYLQSGYVFRYTTSGNTIDSFKVGVIPGEITFNQTYYNADQNGN